MVQQQERYLIGPGLRDKLREVVSRLNDAPIGSSSGAPADVRLQGMTRRAVPLRLCKTTAVFSKGSVATLQVWEDGTPPNESQTSGATVENVVNKYATIASGRWVSVAQHGNGRWYVVAAECP